MPRGAWPIRPRTLALILATAGAIGTAVSSTPGHAQDVADHAPTAAQRAARAQRSSGRWSALRASLEVRFGAMRRVTQLPAEPGLRSFDSGLAPALGLSLAARVAGANHSLRLRFSYQTSVGVVASDRLLSEPVPSTVGVRSHWFEATVAPGLVFGSGSAELSLALGYALRAFASVAPLLLPGYTLHGPLARLEFALRLSSRLSLTVAPEFGLILGVTPALQRVGQLSDTGLSFGGEAGLRVHVHARLTLKLDYRESHARLAGRAPAFEDIERSLVLGGVYRYY